MDMSTSLSLITLLHLGLMAWLNGAHKVLLVRSSFVFKGLSGLAGMPLLSRISKLMEMPWDGKSICAMSLALGR